MKKILLVSDSPYATTGLGKMSKSFLKMLPEFEWVVWGFLHPQHTIKNSTGVQTPIYNEADFPGKFKIYSPKSYTDNQFGLEFVPDLISKEKPDYLITSMDYSRVVPIIDQIKELQFVQDFKWINYYPADREDFLALEVDHFRFPDVNVCITKFGVDQIKKINPKLDIKQIYHPVDPADFPEVKKSKLTKFKHKTWPRAIDNEFLIGTVNRSFARKDSLRLITIFSEFLKRTEGTYAYVHGDRKTFEGADLGRLAFERGIPPGRLAFLPDEVREFDGVPGEVMNKIYRSFDLFVTVSTGEGFGFSTVEALMTETPIIAPYNTCFPELVQDFGYLIKPSEYAFHNNGTTNLWPIVNINEVAEKMIYVKDHYAQAKKKAKRGSEWVKKNLNLEVIAEQWREILK